MSTRGEPSTFALVMEATGRAYFPIAFVARFPYAMIVVGVLTLVVTARHSLALGGLVTACVGLGTAAVGPLIGAAADRFGQRRVVLTAGIANGASLLLIAWCTVSGPDAVMLLSALLVGATAPQVSPLSRSRLVGIISTRMPAARRAGILNSTFSYESAADEVTFVFGPVLVGALATAAGPLAAVIGAALLEFVFVTAFALHPTSRLAAHESAVPRREPASALLRPRLLVLLVGSAGVGLLFGATLTSLTATMTALGGADQSGLMYGAMGVGSAAFALGVALFPPGFTLRARWTTFAAVLLVGALLFALMSGSVGTLLVALFVGGIGVGPTLVTLYSLAAIRSPDGRSATVMTMLGSAIVVGQAAASAIVGVVASAMSVGVAAWAPAIAGLIVLVAALANWLVDRRGGR
jgi:MFS family permease